MLNLAAKAYIRMLRYPKAILSVLLVVMGVAGYFATQFSFDASSDTLVVEGGGGAGADILATATGGGEGDILILKTTTSGANDQVTISDGTGSDTFILAGGADFVMDHLDDRIILIHNGTEWVELSRSDNS